MNVVVLLGNGLSQGFSQELRLDRITTRVRNRLNFADAQLLGEVAALAAPDGYGANAEANFEALAGPIDRIADAMGLLDLLSAAQTQRFVGFRDVADELRRIYTSIVGLVLEEIDEFCVDEAADNGGWADMNALAGALADIAVHHDLSVYTLNYDSLLASALLHNHVAYYDGFRGADRTLNLPLDPWNTNPLNMYQLHGSLAWVDLPGQGETKVDYDIARNQWLPEWAGGNDEVGSPLVVLSDMKSRVVQRYPFDVFYAEFTTDLRHTDAVAIGGYGFGDTPVNSRLASYLVDNDERRITVFSPHAEERCDEWADRLAELSADVDPEQLEPVNSYLPHDPVFETWLTGD